MSEIHGQLRSRILEIHKEMGLDRVVIGVPHPTGSRGMFPGLQDGRFKDRRIEGAFRRVLENPRPICAWFNGKKMKFEKNS